jgi:hypothetical protein
MWRRTPIILKVDTRRKGVVGFVLWPLYPPGKKELKICRRQNILVSKFWAGFCAFECLTLLVFGLLCLVLLVLVLLLSHVISVWIAFVSRF